MFGLENITYWQFAKTILFLVGFYYLSILLYLFIRSRTRSKPGYFEQEEITGEGHEPCLINSEELLKESLNLKTTIKQSLEVRPSVQPDASGYALENLDNPDQKEREAFIKDLNHLTQQHHRP
nr:hypothetical protein [uncultured Carboxylicivirga sp.]